MADKKFDLGDYVEVKDRIRILYELYPQARLVTRRVEILNLGDGEYVVVHALAYRTPEDEHPGTGTSWMKVPGSTSYTKGSEVENAETSAWGRAIGSLGILIDHSIASRQEVENKQRKDVSPLREGAAERRTTHEDGLIGKAIAQGTQDFELREGPNGWSLPFRIKEGKLSQIAVAKDNIALALAGAKDEILGQRVTVWGYYEDQVFDKPNGDTITYKVLHVERIKTPAFEMPAPDAALEAELSTLTEAESEALPWEPLTDDEKAAIAGSLPDA